MTSISLLKRLLLTKWWPVIQRRSPQLWRINLLPRKASVIGLKGINYLRKYKPSKNLKLKNKANRIVHILCLFEIRLFVVHWYYMWHFVAIYDTLYVTLCDIIWYIICDTLWQYMRYYLRHYMLHFVTIYETYMWHYMRHYRWHFVTLSETL